MKGFADSMQSDPTRLRTQLIYANTILHREDSMLDIENHSIIVTLLTFLTHDDIIVVCMA